MLGRGLESLIPPEHKNHRAAGEASPEHPPGRSEPPHVEGPVFQVEVEHIEPNPYQPRKVFDEKELKDLASSIAEFGILQPLVVTKIEKLTDRGTEVRYQLIAGERRLMASKLIGLERVPVVIKSTPEERMKLELAIIENLQRANLNPIESARAYAKLQDQFGLTQREVATRLGKSREVVANTMRLLSLPTYIQEAISQGQLGESQGRLLLAVPNQREQQAMFEDIVRNNLSVRELKQRLGSRMGPSRMSGFVDPQLKNVEEKLCEVLGTKVKVSGQSNKGKITIDFYSPEELQALIDKFFASESSRVDGGGYPPSEEFHI
jgi:ParB family chromosome partitioning protein